MTDPSSPELDSFQLSGLKDQIIEVERLISGLTQKAHIQLAENKTSDVQDTLASLLMASDALSRLNSIQTERINTFFQDEY